MAKKFHTIELDLDSGEDKHIIHGFRLTEHEANWILKYKIHGKLNSSGMVIPDGTPIEGFTFARHAIIDKKLCSNRGYNVNCLTDSEKKKLGIVQKKINTKRERKKINRETLKKFFSG